MLLVKTLSPHCMYAPEGGEVGMTLIIILHSLPLFSFGLQDRQ